MMKRRDFLGVSVGIAGLAGCTDFADSADFDAGTTFSGSDSGPGVDAAEVDAGPGESDAGPSETDGGPGEMDSGPGEMDAGGMDAGPTPACESTSLVIGGGHGPDHEDGGEAPTMEHVAAAEERTYNIQGTSGHPHTYTLTTANFNSLAAGETVEVTSSNDNSHTHSVTIQCMS